MESFQESLVAGAPVMIGFIVIVGFAVAAALSLHRRDMKRMQEWVRDLDGHRSRIESGYGIRVGRDHVQQALQSPHSGVTSRAEMGDGSLEEITLRGTEPVPYRKDGNAWHPLPLTAEPAEALLGGQR